MIIDATNCCDQHANEAVEDLFWKSASEPPDAWAKHQSLFVQNLIELFTERGLFRVNAMQTELMKWLDNEMHKAGPRQPMPAGYVERRTPAELALLKLYLQSLPVDRFTLDDWMLCIDYLSQKYWPAGQLRAEAEWLVTRAAIMGRVQARMAEVTAKQADTILEHSPSTVAAIADRFGLSGTQSAIMNYGVSRCAESIVTVSDQLKQRIKGSILEYKKNELLGMAGPKSDLKTMLFDKFSVANTDWRRIAVTEAGEMMNQGVISSVPVGGRVRRIEQYKGACPFCRKIDGMEFDVVAPDAKDKDGWKQVWPGKTNLGRSAAPRKRVGGELTERDPWELWWPAAGTQHPHCFINPDMPIYTQDGWRPISSIAIGDMVLTHKGRFKPVNWVLDGKPYSGKVAHIRTTFNGKNSSVIPPMTLEHPLLTNRGWVRAEDVKVGDTIKSLAKICPTCGNGFVNQKFETVYCCQKCLPRSGKNQFSTLDPIKLKHEKEKTGLANSLRMKGMTVEQRRELTSSARSVMMERGCAHLHLPEIKRRSGIAASSHNYLPTVEEKDIADMLDCLGANVELQYRVEANSKDSAGRTRYWWIDIALPNEKIAIEIDGDPWHGRLMEDGRDVRRDADLQKNGWTVFRFSTDTAKNEPHKIAESVMRLAMNHSGQYVFSEISVSSITFRTVKDKTLYNFGVEDDESYIIKGGTVVHNCRGVWSILTEPDRAGDEKFTAWLNELLEKK